MVSFDIHALNACLLEQDEKELVGILDWEQKQQEEKHSHCKTAI